MAKSKGKKRTESVRARQQRLLKERRQITRRGTTSPASQRIENVRVKVEGQRQLPAARSQPRLPAGGQGGALTRPGSIRRQNINRNPPSNTVRQGTSNAPNRPQLRLPARATPANAGSLRLATGILSRISLLLSAGLITKDLADQMRDGIGLARIPGLIEKYNNLSKQNAKAATANANPGSRRTGGPNRSGKPVTQAKPDNKDTSKGGPKEGDTKIVNNKRLVYRKGKWVNEGRPRTQGPPKPVNKDNDKDKDKPTNNNNTNTNRRPTPKPTKRTGANDPRNAEYIAARSKLNANSTKEERDRVRDMGLAIHNKVFGKKTKASPSSSTPSSTKRVNSGSSNGAPGAMGAAQRELERQRKEKKKKEEEKKKRQRRKGRALAIGGYA